MNKAEMIERYGIEYYNECLRRQKERYNNDPRFRDYMKGYQKDRYINDPSYRDYHIEYMKDYANNQKFKEYHKEYQKQYIMNDLNSEGITKNSIRYQSRHILFKQRNHAKLKDYQIHHCFGYDDPSKFIYIPRTLHKAIHQFLRDNNINADTDHYKYISTMINECTDYTYISA